jgi:hypothetical protein
MEGMGSGSGALSKKGRIRRLGNLETPTTIRILQRKLYRKAKSDPGYRFYLLYQKLKAQVVNHADDFVILYHGTAQLNAAAPHLQFDEREMETGHGRNNVAPSGNQTANREHKPWP